MSVSIYLILLIILLIFNLVFWILVIWFRIIFECDFGKCCGRRDSSDETDTPIGHRNLGYVDNEDLFNNRPATIAEQMESPPSYEDALKYDRFGFQTSPPEFASLQSSSPISSSSSRQGDSLQSTHIITSERNTATQISQSPPRLPEFARSRSSTSGSNSVLTPIREEEVDDMPVTVVIDCIGVQASRLLENCDTKLELSGGENLNDHSKC